MSIETIVSRVAQRIASRKYQIADPSSLDSILHGFQSSLLLKADNRSGGRVIDIFSRVAVESADHRRRKFKKDDGRVVLLSDFVPAFHYVGDLCTTKLRERFPQNDVAVFTKEVSEIVRQCCPWC